MRGICLFKLALESLLQTAMETGKRSGTKETSWESTLVSPISVNVGYSTLFTSRRRRSREAEGDALDKGKTEVGAALSSNGKHTGLLDLLDVFEYLGREKVAKRPGEVTRGLKKKKKHSHTGQQKGGSEACSSPPLE